jgi:hypothetical protein
MRLVDAVNQYDEVRVVHRDLLASQVGGPDAAGQARVLIAHLSGGLYRNAEAIDPVLVAAQKVELDTWGDRVRAAPQPVWPAPAVARLDEPWFPTANRAAFLRWVAVSQAEPWAPTLGELRAELARLEQVLEGARG